MQFKDWLNENNKDIPIINMLISRNSLFGAMQDIQRGRISRSKNEPINVWQVSGREYQLTDGYHRIFEILLLTDGYHRIFEILLLTNQHSVLSTIVGKGYSDYYAIAGINDRFKYNPNTEFHGLESLVDEEILEELKEKLTH